jgi:hypothetical protein
VRRGHLNGRNEKIQTRAQAEDEGDEIAANETSFEDDPDTGTVTVRGDGFTMRLNRGGGPGSVYRTGTRAGSGSRGGAPDGEGDDEGGIPCACGDDVGGDGDFFGGDIGGDDVPL